MSCTDGSGNEGLSHFLRQEMHTVCQIGEPHGSQLLSLLPASTWSPAYMTGKGKKQLECLVSLPAAVCERSPSWELKLILKDLVQSSPLFRQCLVDMSGASFRRQSTYQLAKHQPQEMTHKQQNKNPSGKKITDLLRTCRRCSPSEWWLAQARSSCQSNPSIGLLDAKLNWFTLICINIDFLSNSQILLGSSAPWFKIFSPILFLLPAPHNSALMKNSTVSPLLRMKQWCTFMFFPEWTKSEWRR